MILKAMPEGTFVTKRITPLSLRYRRVLGQIHLLLNGMKD